MRYLLAIPFALLLAVQAQVMLPHRRGVPVQSATSGSTPPPLNSVTGLPYSAYSVARKLSSSYAGYAYRATYDSNVTTLDVGFTAGGLVDTNSLMTWAGTKTAIMTILYDQSGNNKHLDSGTAPGTAWTNGIQLATNGTLFVDALNRPAAYVRRDTAQCYIKDVDTSGMTNYTYLVVTYPLANIDDQLLVSLGSVNDGALRQADGNGWKLDNGGTQLNGPFYTLSNQYLLTAKFDVAGDETFQLDTNAVYTGNAGGNSSAPPMIGDDGGGSYSARQLFSEWLIYPTPQLPAADVSTLQSNLMSFYQITNASAYVAGTAVFDGANDYMSFASSGPTGLADGKTFTFSTWANFSGGDGNTQYILWMGDATPNARLYVRRVSATNVIQVVGYNAAGSAILNLQGSTAVTASSGWTHIYVAIDLTDTGKRKIYINGLADTLTVTTYSNDTLDLVGTSYQYGVGATLSDFSAKLTAALAELWFNDAYLDDPTKFISSGDPIYLGADGSTPTGASPVFYLRLGGNNFDLNSGTGGNFSITGSLGTTTPP